MAATTAIKMSGATQSPMRGSYIEPPVMNSTKSLSTTASTSSRPSRPPSTLPRNTTKSSPPRSASPGASLPSPKRARRCCGSPTTTLSSTSGLHMGDRDRYPARRALDAFAMPQAAPSIGGVPMPQCRIQIDTSSQALCNGRPAYDRSDSAIACASSTRQPPSHRVRDSLSPLDDRLTGPAHAARDSTSTSSTTGSPASAISSCSFLSHRRSSSTLSVGSGRNTKRLSISLPVKQVAGLEIGGGVGGGQAASEQRRGSLSLSRATGGGAQPQHRKALSMLSGTVPGPSSQAITLPLSRELAAGISDESYPYELGPKEVLPGVWIGSERSMTMWDVWCPPRVGRERRGLVINVAQELRDPFLPDGEAGVYPARYAATHDRPSIEYVCAPWSHGQADLADGPVDGGESWNFRRTIDWLERGRSSGLPVLIHCQCGISRSATLLIAYVLYLAHSGAGAEATAHLRGQGMMGVYDWAKTRSRWIGPNVALMSQLLAWERVLQLEYGAGGEEPAGLDALALGGPRVAASARAEKTARDEALALDLQMSRQRRLS